MKKKIFVIVGAVFLALGLASPVFAATTANLTNTATPKFIGIAVSGSPYDWGAVATSATPSTSTSYFTTTNTSSIAIDVTIATVSAPSGGLGWTWSDTATAGTDTVGESCNVGGTWGVGDIIIKLLADSPNNIVTNKAATTDWSFGLKLYVPTSFSDGVQKSWVVRQTATEH